MSPFISEVNKWEVPKRHSSLTPFFLFPTSVLGSQVVSPRRHMNRQKRSRPLVGIYQQTGVPLSSSFMQQTESWTYEPYRALHFLLCSLWLFKSYLEGSCGARLKIAQLRVPQSKGIVNGLLLHNKTLISPRGGGQLQSFICKCLLQGFIRGKGESSHPLIQRTCTYTFPCVFNEWW